MKKGLIIVVSGPSGVGKGTVIKEMMSRTDVFEFSISATTRAPRKGETDGVEYHFITREEFEKNIKDGKMLEYTNYNGNYYGTPRSSVESVVSKGKNVVLDIEVEGAANVKRMFPKAISIFILPPDFDTLQKRLEGRGSETPDTLQKRLDRSKVELELAQNYDYRVVNDSVTRCADRLLEIVGENGGL